MAGGGWGEKHGGGCAAVWCLTHAWWRKNNFLQLDKKGKSEFHHGEQAKPCKAGWLQSKMIEKK